MNLKNIIFKYWDVDLTLITAILSGAITGYWSYTHGNITNYIDGVGHLNIARRIIDNQTPGLGQLGSSWLPLHHLLMLPFVMNDFLYRTGLAGTIISYLSYVVSALFIYLSIKLLTKNIFISLTGVCLFIFNSNILYMQTTPMGELPTIMFLSGSIYTFLYWVQKQDLASLVFLSVVLFLGSLTRFEFWALNLATLQSVCLVALNLKAPLKQKLKVVQGKAILFAYVAFFGIFLWLLWNQLIFHDYLFFIRNSFSAEAYQRSLISAGLNRPYHNLLESFIYYAHAVADNSSWPIFAIGVVGLLIFLFKNKNFLGIPVVIFFMAIFVFESASMYLGNTTIYVKELPPFDYYNIRYGLYLLPFLIVSTYYLFSILHSIGKKLTFLASFIILIWAGYFFVHYEPVSFAEPMSNGPIVHEYTALQDQKLAGQFLRTNYKSGKILASSGLSDPVIFYSGIDIKNYISEGNQTFWTESLINPSKYSDWLVIQSNLSNVRNLLGREVRYVHVNIRHYLLSKGGFIPRLI